MLKSNCLVLKATVCSRTTAALRGNGLQDTLGTSDGLMGTRKEKGGSEPSGLGSWYRGCFLTVTAVQTQGTFSPWCSCPMFADRLRWLKMRQHPQQRCLKGYSLFLRRDTTLKQHACWIWRDGQSRSSCQYTLKVIPASPYLTPALVAGPGGGGVSLRLADNHNCHVS